MEVLFAVWYDPSNYEIRIEDCEGASSEFLSESDWTHALAGWSVEVANCSYRTRFALTHGRTAFEAVAYSSLLA